MGNNVERRHFNRKPSGDRGKPSTDQEGPLAGFSRRSLPNPTGGPSAHRLLPRSGYAEAFEGRRTLFWPGGRWRWHCSLQGRWAGSAAAGAGSAAAGSSFTNSITTTKLTYS